MKSNTKSLLSGLIPLYHKILQRLSLEKYLNKDEIIKDLIENDNITDLILALNDPFEAPGAGRYIRNKYNLWAPNNPHTCKRWVPVLRDGCDYSPYHPDNFSGLIIDELKERYK